MTQESYINHYKKMVDQLVDVKATRTVFLSLVNMILNDKKLTTETRDILFDYIDKFM